MTSIPNPEAVRPEGLAAQLLSVTIMFSIVCAVVVCLRMWQRHVQNCLGVEDWLMAVGVVLNLVHNGIVIWGCFIGIGTRDEKLSSWQVLEGYKVMLFWQLFYITSSVFIKSSICSTLIRIAPNRIYTWLLQGLIAVSVATTIAAMAVVLARCKPISANWDPGAGQCVSQNLIIVFTYVVSTVNVATDWSVAIMPVLILWNVQMKRGMKVLTWVMLGIDNIAYVILWTVVECGLGLIAGSLPMLRRLVRGFAAMGSRQPKYSREGSDETQLVTIGRVKNRKRLRAHGISNFSVQVREAGEDSDTPGGDGESTRGIVDTPMPKLH